MCPVETLSQRSRTFPKYLKSACMQETVPEAMLDGEPIYRIQETVIEALSFVLKL